MTRKLAPSRKKLVEIFYKEKQRKKEDNKNKSPVCQYSFRRYLQNSVMATASIDLGDFTCSVCREIFENPVTLCCSHAYCQSCLNGLKKSPSTTDVSSLNTSSIPSSPVTRTLIYTPQLHENNQCFTCAICRKDSLGYLDCRELETDLKTIEAPCPQCEKPFMLCYIRKHLDTCTPPKKKMGPEDLRKIFNREFLQKLSQPQAQALEQARGGENRSTFHCPYCERANFTVEHLCKHMEKHHLEEQPTRVCPICASMPWGDKGKVSSNVYQHIVGRHQFTYDTYVNYDQNEETMIAEALERSMLHH